MRSTIYLNVNEAWSQNQAIAIDGDIGKRSFIVEKSLWVENFSISYPKVIDHNLMTSEKPTIAKLQKLPCFF